jgi:hypothetical protein
MSRKESAILTIILLAILMIFVWMLTGCRTVEKVVERERLIKDSTSVRQVDSLLVVQHDLIQQYETTLQEMRDAGVVFSEIPCPDNPNTVEITPDGGIKASGAIKSANVKESTLQLELARLRSTYDSLLHIQRKDSIQVHTQYKTITKTVSRKAQPSWYLWLIFLVAGMVLEYRFKLIRFIKQKIQP